MAATESEKPDFLSFYYRSVMKARKTLAIHNESAEKERKSARRYNKHLSYRPTRPLSAGAIAVSAR
jgi:hypothetical protein